MKILSQDRNRNLIRLRAESLDDLWHLHHLIEPGDLCTAYTFRRQEEQADQARAGRPEKVGMLLTIEVEEVEFHEFATRLRILGVIREGPQEHGAHHTFNLDEGDEVTVVKPGGWRKVHLDRIQQAMEASERPRVTFLAIEDDEATLAVLRQYGIHEVATIAGAAGGKQYEGASRTRDDFFAEVLAKLEQVHPQGNPLVVVGPGFAKEDLVAYAKQRGSAVFDGAIVEGTGQAGRTGIQEAMKRGLADRVAKDARVMRETQLVERVLTAIARDEPATYGAAYVARALELGAAEVVLVTDERVKHGDGEALLDAAEATGAEAHVVSTGHEAGEKLEALGGVAALLRYAVPEDQLAGEG